jgi:hypothetical protein
MTRYIGKRVFYMCDQCGKPFTLNKKSITDRTNNGEVFCSERCFEQFRLDQYTDYNKKQQNH